MGLLSFLQGLVTGGNASGWTAFGQSNAAKGVPDAGTEQGQDIGLTLGTPIPAEPGKVIAVEPWGFGDYAVSEQLDTGQVVTVGHVTPQVSVGQVLTSDSILGTSRGIKSPISTGPHIEVRYQTGPDKPFTDPLTIIQGGKGSSETGTANAQPSASDIPVVGGLLGLLPNIFGDIVRIILGILAIIAFFLALYTLFRPNDAPTITEAAGMAAKVAVA